jgi:hypothetical protein
VIAHEVGHHVQNLIGITDKVRAAQQRSFSDRAEIKYNPYGLAKKAAITTALAGAAICLLSRSASR